MAGLHGHLARVWHASAAVLVLKNAVAACITLHLWGPHQPNASPDMMKHHSLTAPDGVGTVRVAMQVVISFINKNYLSDLAALRRIFFSEQTAEEDVKRYQDLLNEFGTTMSLVDLKKLRV
jgi:hypothetical protein